MLDYHPFPSNWANNTTLALSVLYFCTCLKRVFSHLTLLLSTGEQTVPETVSEIHQENVDVTNDMDRSTDIHDGKILKLRYFYLIYAVPTLPPRRISDKYLYILHAAVWP